MPARRRNGMTVFFRERLPGAGRIVKPQQERGKFMPAGNSVEGEACPGPAGAFDADAGNTGIRQRGFPEGEFVRQGA